MKCSRDYLDLINSFDDPYLEISVTGEILLQNRALKSMVGEVVGKQIHDLFAANDRHVLDDMIFLAVAQKTPQEALLGLKPLSGNQLCISLSAILSQHTHSAKNQCLRCRLHIVHEHNHVHKELIEAQRALRKQTKELAILNHLSMAITSTLDLNIILDSICKEMVSVFDARNTGIALLNDSQTKLKVVAFQTKRADETDATGLEIPLEGNAASLFVIKTGEPIVVPDAQFNPITNSVHRLMLQRGTECMLIVPLLARGDVIGTIGIPSDSQKIFSREDVQLAMIIASQIASVIDNARLHRRVQEARDNAELELEIGRQIQIGFFPETLPQLSGWELFSYFQSARQVAGDFYDAFFLNNRRVAVVLADVCDKGLGAALFMVLFRSLLRTNIQQSFTGDSTSATDPGEMIVEAVGKTNNYVAINHAQASMFATVFIAVLERDRDTVWYINCGHDPPFILRADGQSNRLMPTSPAIGALPDISLSSNSLYMRSGDSLIAFTDGVGDARSIDGSIFGKKRLLNIVNNKAPLSQRLDLLANELSRH
ncbi:MAG: SpoIIE family protein phosphatase, partial [Desulforhopalus sp.]